MRRTLVVQDSYKLEELSDSAQQHAYEKYCENHEYGWSEENREVLTEFERIFPVNVKDWNVSPFNRTDISFNLTVDQYEVEEFTGVRLATWLFNNYGRELWEPRVKFLRMVGNSTNKKRRSRIFIEPTCLTGYCLGFDILEPIRKFIDKPSGSDLEGLMSECLHAWLFGYQNDWESQLEEEYFKREASDLEMMFDEEGNQL